MKAIRTLNYLAIAATCAGQIVVCALPRGLVRLVNRGSLSAESDLPALTRAVLSYADGSAPVTVGLIAAVIFGFGLIYLANSEKRVQLLPVGLVVAWIFGFLHFGTVLIGLSMGLIGTGAIESL